MFLVPFTELEVPAWHMKQIKATVPRTAHGAREASARTTREARGQTKGCCRSRPHPSTLPLNEVGLKVQHIRAARGQGLMINSVAPLPVYVARCLLPQRQEWQVLP